MFLSPQYQIFSAFRNPISRVCHLNISKCTLGAEDLVCLGETVRFTRCLSSLRMEGLSRMAEIIPVLIALQVSVGWEDRVVTVYVMGKDE